MMFKITESTYVWDMYAQIAAHAYANNQSLSPQQAAERTAEFADEMCRQRAVRIPVEKK